LVDDHTLFRSGLKALLSRQSDFEEIAATVLKRFERQTQVKAHLRLLGNGLPLSSDQKLQAIFILQEALSNVRKHAHAETVLVTVRNEADFSMTIMDDGVGIDERLMQERQQRHVGLSIMQERAQKVSGSIEIESESQVGTTVRFKLPKEVRQAL
jgi:two-component system nitrate/nitrite sensor histidine kinase NarX